MTQNTISSAIPEISLILATQSQAGGKPLPPILQLPSNQDLRQELHAEITLKLNPDGNRTEAGFIAEHLQRQNPIKELH